MRFQFVHAADIHLGHEQYNLPTRTNDFARAYLDMVRYGVDHTVDFVIVAGDLFHHARADAMTLKQAIAGLETLREAGIPVVAIEGNHDAQHYYRSLSWMQFLCEQGLLVLLDVERAPNGLTRLVPFNEEDRLGSYLDLSGARIYGVKYYGATTARIIEEVGGDVTPGPHGYTIVMLHAGMQGQVPHLHGGLSPAQLEPLLPATDYIALGHVHKRLIEDPIFNPGSLETNSMEEMDWQHGFFHVTVDTEASPKHTVKAVASPHLRPFRRINVTADGSETLEEFTRLVEERIGSAGTLPEKAVIELSLGGTAGFRRQDLPLERLRGEVEVRYSPLVVRTRNALAPPGTVRASRAERASRADLERATVEQMVYNNPDYRDSAAGWTALILDVKNMAAERDLPANIVDRVRAVLVRIADESFGEVGSDTALPADDSPHTSAVTVGDAGDGSDALELPSAGSEQTDSSRPEPRVVTPSLWRELDRSTNNPLGPATDGLTEFDVADLAAEDW
jgi:DNA repair exonuclease SbcCD nuclease subunit